MRNKTKNREEELKEIKEIMKEHIEDANCGLFDTRNTAGDTMETLYKGKYFQLNMCYLYSYFEIFGTTFEEFNELKTYYEKIKNARIIGIGDILKTKDGRYTGKVSKIENKIVNNELRIFITIESNFAEYKADINEFIIF